MLSSPPYNIAKEYEEPLTLQAYQALQLSILQEATRTLRPGGSLCWQVGTSFLGDEMLPLDCIIHALVSSSALRHELQLRNRIIWSFEHGFHTRRRFSGRYETILWYTKGENYTFNLDSVRIPQKYPGKKAWKGPRAGQLSGHPLGKNPSDFWNVPQCDVWPIPNVKHNHIEKVDHPCQFPIELCSRLILALTDRHEIVIDPFGGVGTTAAAAVMLDRRAISIDRIARYSAQARKRVRDAYEGTLEFRASRPILEPDSASNLARLPASFAAARRLAAPSSGHDNSSSTSI